MENQIDYNIDNKNEEEKGMKILTILTNGFEELECIGSVALWKRAGFEVDIHAIEANEATGRFNVTLANLHNLNDVALDNYDALFIPGGPHYSKIEGNETVRKIIDYFMGHDKVVSAICAAPTILGHMGYLRGKKYTCFTSMNEDFGGTFIDAYYAVDGKLITGRSAAATIDFAFAVMDVLGGEELVNKVKADIYY